MRGVQGLAGRISIATILLLLALLISMLVDASTATALPVGCTASDDFSATAAPPLFPSCFEGADGNMTADGPSPKAVDWQNLVGSAGTVVTQDGTGDADDTFQAGSKEQVPGGWSFVLSPSSPKDDIFVAAGRADPLSSDVFLYLGSILKAANGSFDESFELNQLSPGTPENPTYRSADVGGTLVALPARRTGDVLLAFDTNAGTVTIGVCTWKSDQPDPAPGNHYPAGYFDSGAWYLLNGTALDNTNDKACTQINPATTPAAQGAINTSTIVAADNPISNADVVAGNFGELSVDISKALTTDANPSPCFNFASIWMRTRSSNQVNSNPEDVTFPRPIVVSGCASDTTPPVTSVILAPATPNGTDGWYTSVVHVTVSAVDPDDAVDETRCVLDPAIAPATFDALPASCLYLGAGTDVSSDGEHALYFASADSHGNKEAVTSKSFKIDATTPTLNVSDVTVDAPTPSGATVSSYPVSASDITSGLQTVVCNPAAPHTFAIGDTTVSCTATDNAGNTATKAFVVHVLGAAAQLQDLVAEVHGVAPGTSLASKVETALNDLNSGDISDACKDLRAFISQVKAQRGKKLTTQQASQLIADATRIRASIGC
jgi:hypothetical protein